MMFMIVMIMVMTATFMATTRTHIIVILNTVQNYDNFHAHYVQIKILPEF